ncbi:hypothetical protein SAMN05216233_105193 [Desulfoluna spongiiphila]|uniref:Uncharacterized protein n=1 Tax=Desulfoluna spongiiphila TaxID=419481 RepID=A0A1G5E5W9_9BACT|nr:hypothetical protein SAMN05216233_105193 [Desulfoluna spongiiphila]
MQPVLMVWEVASPLRPLKKRIANPAKRGETLP